jgi:hypothetical protein
LNNDEGKYKNNRIKKEKQDEILEEHTSELEEQQNKRNEYISELEEQKNKNEK